MIKSLIIISLLLLGCFQENRYFWNKQDYDKCLQGCKEGEIIGFLVFNDIVNPAPVSATENYFLTFKSILKQEKEPNDSFIQSDSSIVLTLPLASQSLGVFGQISSTDVDIYPFSFSQMDFSKRVFNISAIGTKNCSVYTKAITPTTNSSTIDSSFNFVLNVNETIQSFILDSQTATNMYIYCAANSIINNYKILLVRLCQVAHVCKIELKWS
ncbi:MAG TPA: hypothetical protein PK079_21265, partial [Leptospiraceae bacterium]|nr:hypothetical protein [Leptospiraceae bacterium]HMW07517.1 hypothetical protein [Leptospiraceae bacterium]HMX35354.1 hypothetical protein [Leptospiraceae bacterium]HMY33089.1 hypothetical protein [Leptospiraceae bacterium]HMZ64215.1 hypothetical protein [Leptospiraceae bacterium]